MTTLVSDIIYDGYRESNLTAIEVQPTGAQTLEGVKFLNRLVPSLLGYEAGENLSNVYVNDVPDPSIIDVYNSRLVFNQTAPVTITLPDVLTDGTRFGYIDPNGVLGSQPVTLLGGKNTILGGPSLTLHTSNDSSEFFYRADLGDWRKVTPLLSTDIWPFPTEFDDLFVVSLAFRLNPRYNISSQAESLATMKRSMGQFRSRYKQSRQVGSELALVRLLNSPVFSYTEFDKGSI